MPKTMTCCAAFVAVVVLSACARDPAPMAVGDYCFKARPPIMQDLASPGETVAVGPDGFGSATVLSRRDAETVAGEISKFEESC